MPNRSYRDFEDEMRDDKTTPYDSISSRGPLKSLTGASEMRANGGDSSPNEAVKNAIMARATDKLKNPLSETRVPQVETLSSLERDPMMQEFNKNRTDLTEYRKAKSDADFISNLGQSFSQLSQGVNAPKENTQLYSNLNRQGEEMLQSQTDEQSRRAAVLGAIEARKSREAMAAENRASRLLMAKQHSEDLASRASDKEDIRKEQKLQKYRTQMDTLLDPNKARAGNMALNQKRIDNADRVQALLSQVHNNPDPRQMEELAISTQALLSSSGSPAAEQVKALIPHTAMANVNAFKEWLTNDPTGTGQQEFVKRMAETVDREKDVARSQVQKAQRSHLPLLSEYKKSDPQGYQAQLAGFGLSEEPDSAGSFAQEKTMGASMPVKMQAPDGSIRMIPPDQVSAAEAAGGKRL